MLGGSDSVNAFDALGISAKSSPAEVSPMHSACASCNSSLFLRVQRRIARAIRVQRRRFRLAAGLGAAGNRTGVPFPARCLRPPTPGGSTCVTEPGNGASGQPGYVGCLADGRLLWDSDSRDPPLDGAASGEVQGSYGDGVKSPVPELGVG